MVGANIKHYREMKEMTQEELSEKIGMSRPMISQMERGTKNPSPQTLADLSEIFGITIDELVRGKI